MLWIRPLEVLTVCDHLFAGAGRVWNHRGRDWKSHDCPSKPQNKGQALIRRLWLTTCETNYRMQCYEKKSNTDRNICDNNRTGVLWYNSYKSVNALTASTWYRGWNMCSGQCRAHWHVIKRGDESWLIQLEISKVIQLWFDSVNLI